VMLNGSDLVRWIGTCEFRGSGSLGNTPAAMGPPLLSFRVGVNHSSSPSHRCITLICIGAVPLCSFGDLEARRSNPVITQQNEAVA
jgi:hypothetical protein